MSLQGVLLLISAILFVQNRQAASDGEVLDDQDNSSCQVPLHFQPAFEMHRERNITQLLVEGRCYLSCFSRHPFYRKDTHNITIYPVWPFAVYNDGLNCSAECAISINQCILGCIRCITYPDTCNGNLEPCTVACINESPSCGYPSSCINPGIVDLTIPGCGSPCEDPLSVNPACQDGCSFRKDELNIKIKTLPFSPISPPTLVKLYNSSLTSEKRLFSVNLTSAAGGRMDEDGPNWNGFLFRIHDIDSGNITYVWQNDPREHLDLTGYICLILEVSFAVVNRYGPSNFSEATVVCIDRDTCEIPDPPIMLQVEDTRDTRIGFFPHVVINVTWDTPKEDTYLLYYEAVLEEAESSDMLSGCGTSDGAIDWELVNHTSNGSYSILFEADNASGYLLMGHTYRVKVASVGLDGNRYECVYFTTRSLQDYSSEVVSFSCSPGYSVHDSNDIPYFLFHLKWVVASNVAEGPFIQSFALEVEHSMSSDSQVESLQMFQPSTAINAEVNKMKYIYTEVLPHSNIDSSQINLTINWNQLMINSTLDSYICNRSAGPFNVREFMLLYVNLISNESVRVQASWLPPQDINGVSSNYTLCLLREQLKEFAEPPLDNCKEINNEQTSIDMNLKLINLRSDEIIYLQIQARISGLRGGWSSIAINASDILPSTDATTSGDILPSTDATTSGDILPSTDATTSVTTASNSFHLNEELTAVVVIFIVVPIILTVCIGCLIYVIRNQKKKMRLLRLTDAVPNIMPMMATKNIETPILLKIDYCETVIGDDWELSASDITVEEMLGEGAFGMVYKGYIKGPLTNSKVKPEFRNNIHIPVAMKLLKDTTKGSEKRGFLLEIEMMKKVSEGHNPHVVTMLGCVTTQEPLCLFTEYVEYGDLLSYLRSSRNLFVTGVCGDAHDPYIQLGKLTPTDLPSFSYQIAAGMAYLSSIGIVHRDLACRNVLVSADKALKITDFGLSRETNEIYVQQSTGRVPYKWMALESILAREFTSASDVWAFGIVLWEIGTIGGVPYPGVSNAELVPFLKSGQRMEKPEGCSAEIYRIMCSCWQDDASRRPKFNMLQSKFNDILLSLGTESYIDFNTIDPDKLYYEDDEQLDFVDDHLELPEFMDLLNSPARERSLSVSSSMSLGSTVRQRRTSLPHLLSKIIEHQKKNFSSTLSVERVKPRLCTPEEVVDETERSRSAAVSLSSQHEVWRRGSTDQVMGDKVDRYVMHPYGFIKSTSSVLDGTSERVYSRQTVTVGEEH